MPCAIWPAATSFGLVNAPVKMHSAIDEHGLELQLVHEKDAKRGNARAGRAASRKNDRKQTR